MTMPDWRDIFGFEGSDLDFELVYFAYHARLMTLSGKSASKELAALDKALEEARIELGN